MPASDLHQESSSPKTSTWRWIPVAILLLVLLASSLYSYLLFHTLAEIFAIIVAILLSLVAWQMYPFTRNNYLMFLGCGYFWVGVLDLVHTLTYQGMNVFHIVGGNVTVQFWIATRYVEALLLLLAPLYLSKSLSRGWVFTFFAIVSGAIFVMIFMRWFPDAYIDQQGLTDFKIYSEYSVIALLGLAIYHLKSKRNLLDKGIYRLIIVSMMLTMCAEMAFTFYVNLYGISNFVGHVFKLFSYWLIFVAVVRTTLEEPFLALSRSANTYDAIPNATIVVDSNGIVRQSNKEAAKLIGLSEVNILGKHCHQLYHPPSLDVMSCPVCHHISSNAALNNIELYNEGTDTWYDYSLSPIQSASHITEGMVQVIRDVSERKKAQNSQERAAKRLQILHDIDDAVLRASSPGMIAQAVMGLLSELIRNSRISITLFNEDKSYATILAVHGMGNEELQAGKTIPNDGTFGDLEILRQGGINRMIDLQSEPAPAPVIRQLIDSGLSSYMNVPLIVENKLIGTLNLASKEEIEFSEETVEVAREVANSLAISIQQANLLEQIQKYASELEQRVELRTLELKAANSELESFSYSVSHDLRAPLRSINGFSQLLMEDYGDTLDDTANDYLTRVSNASQRMSELIDAILIMSRQTRGALDVQPIELSELANDTIEQLNEEFPERDIKVNIQPSMKVVADKRLMRVVLENLIGNAWKYTGNTSNPSVDVFSEQRDGEILFCVKDNGAGFNMKYANRLFDAFQRLHKADEFSGMGVGLATVHRIITRHGGEVWAEGKENEGAKFCFTLPQKVFS